MKIKTRIHCTDSKLSDLGLKSEGEYRDAVLNLEHIIVAWCADEEDDSTQIETISGYTYTVDTPFTVIEKLMTQ